MAGTTGRSGGRRKGAGRKPGAKSRNKPAPYKDRREAIEAAVDASLAAGESPLEYFLDVMANAMRWAEDAGNGEGYVPDLGRRDWAASQAAPFIHARLQSKLIEQKVDTNITVRWATTEAETTK